MFNDYDEYAAPSVNDSLQVFAHTVGEENKDHAWLLHDRDVWIANPHYTGPEVPHPESDYYED